MQIAIEAKEFLHVFEWLTNKSCTRDTLSIGKLLKCEGRNFIEVIVDCFVFFKLGNKFKPTSPYNLIRCVIRSEPILILRKITAWRSENVY